MDIFEDADPSQVKAKKEEDDVFEDADLTAGMAATRDDLTKKVETALIAEPAKATREKEGPLEEEDDDDDINANIVYDEEQFFQAPSICGEELKQASTRICAAFQVPLDMLEQGGFAAYCKYLKERAQTKKREDVTQKERMAQILEEATIQGDPREYQRVLFEIAKERNTIIHLGTGYGKTLIALLCIRHFSDAFETGKQTLFLVPSVALAIQQSTTLRANLPGYSIQTACYASSNSGRARLALAKSNVLVATHGAVST
jgi:primosomal protein N'